MCVCIALLHYNEDKTLMIHVCKNKTYKPSIFLKVRFFFTFRVPVPTKSMLNVDIFLFRFANAYTVCRSPAANYLCRYLHTDSSCFLTQTDCICNPNGTQQRHHQTINTQSLCQNPVRRYSTNSSLITNWRPARSPVCPTYVSSA